MGAVRVIVLTASVSFYNLCKDGLKNKAGIEILLNATNSAELESKFSRISNNVLLVDLDSVTVTAPLLSSYTEKYKLLVILTGISQLAAKNYISLRVKEFIQKPLTSPTALNLYFTHLYTKLLDFNGMNSRKVDSMRAADINSKILTIASSTGGTDALEKVFKSLSVQSANLPPTIVVQHMPSGFTKLFADRLNNIYPFSIKEAEQGEYLQRGQILIAPAGVHLKLIRKDSKLAVDLFTGPKVHGVIPAADILFDSVADLVKNRAIGVILTGMGADGARGLMKMHLNGAKTIAQDKETCVVYGMPKVAVDLGAVDYVLPITSIGGKILELVNA